MQPDLLFSFDIYVMLLLLWYVAKQTCIFGANTKRAEMKYNRFLLFVYPPSVQCYSLLTQFTNIHTL